MIKANIYQIKVHFSEYLAKLELGESVVICRRNAPIAEMRPLAHHIAEPRPIGLAKGTFKVPPAFFEPLPDEITKTFYSGFLPDVKS